jgi:nucleotide-binding universal stress UspA family protein
VREKEGSQKFAPKTCGWHHAAEQGKPQARRTPFMSIFPTKILLATDRSREAQLAATTAADLAKSTNSELHVVHVGFEQIRDEAQKELDTEVDMIRETGAQDIQAHLKFGMPARRIVDLAEELGAGLIVMGSRGLGGVRRPC